jgi:hypothetical protein
MEAIDPGVTGRARRSTERLYTRAALAKALREEHGYPVSVNMLEKGAHYGTGPAIAGKWGKFAMYTLPEGLRWARARFRDRRAIEPSRKRT